ncbi:UNC79 [Bugula neritina]|uniref:UNC79 n=1 Tax=Bugula neritina TaxID=10212 RepID=A0A7J7JWX1_BUGNE|nr:UNC79 [Bugula neritina]
MATKDLTFSSKIKILGGHVVQLTSPNHCPPVGTDVTNTLKYFTNTLINILKEAPGIDGERFYGAKYAKSSLRITLFPTLSYSNLYRVVCDLLPVVHLVTTNQQALMETLLHLISCLTPFLTWEELMEFPYHVALMIPTTDPAYYSSIIRILCVYLLPNALGRGVDDNIVAQESVSGILMLILQHCDDPQLHSMAVESLLPLRDHLYRDLFTVMSYGPPNTKMPAATLLFHYWPQLQSLLDRYKHIKPAYVVKPWEVPLCQRLRCINKISRSLASKMCTHPNMCAGECGLPPPAFICIDCFDTFVMRQYDNYFTNIVLPAAAISVSCGNKACTSADKKAVSVCASHECVKHNRFRPVSLCQSCDDSRHPGNCGFVQTSIPNIWTMDHEIRSYVVDAIVNLLREAEPARKSSTIDTALQPIMDHTMERFMVVMDSLNSRYGILLIKELCEPKGNLVTESLGRLMGMLFHWFQCTGSTNRPETTETLENSSMGKTNA